MKMLLRTIQEGLQPDPRADPTPPPGGEEGPPSAYRHPTGTEEGWTGDKGSGGGC